MKSFPEIIRGIFLCEVDVTDREYMKKALRLAEKGEGRTSPNPCVGAVIVKDGRIIGSGFHERFGGPHAERNALASCTEDPRGATMYVTLEPCRHFGKQPPCTDAVIGAGIAKVVIGSSDPNPAVSGKGVKALSDSGIEVVEGVLKDECDRLNEPFFHYITTGKPFVVMKYAMTLDGKIAAARGEKTRITGDAALRHVHSLRNKYSAIAVGVGTVISDDPMLTCRIKNCVDPVRVVCDTRLRTPLTSNIVKTANKVRTVIATCSDDMRAISELERSSVEVWKTGERDGRVDLVEFTERLGKAGIDSLIIEGGGTLNRSALACGIVDKVQAYISPKLFGGGNAPTPVDGELLRAVELENTVVKRLGGDFLLEGHVKKCLRA